ncbi:extracellular solute-binding protein [Planosporangium sp. 12N6]|uniref:extracellular solute-binding protein n=1 Tax=Planosporangium spinosum TaxID=3402278 RepID=UPI003CEF1D75
MAGLGAGALALGAAGCGSDGKSAGNGAGELDIWALQDTVQNKVQRTAIDKYNATAKGKAKLTTYDNDPYKQKLRIAMGSPQQPDVFFNWGGGSIRQYVQSNLLVDLTPMLDADPAFKAKFLPSVLDAGKIGDKYYGIPNRGMQPVVMFYNQQVFDKAKVSAPPKTWAELMSQVDAFKAAGVSAFTLAGSQPWTMLMWLEYLVDRIGGPTVFGGIAGGNKDGWRDPAVTQALNAIIDLVKKGGFNSNFASVGYDGASGAGTLFAQGKTAMHLMGSWEYTAQLDQQPAFAKSGLRWAAFPAFDGGKGDPKAVVGNPTNYFSVTKRSDNVDGAKEFLKLMASDEYVDTWIANGDVPAIAGIESKLAQSKNGEFGTFAYTMVQEAPSFQLSWDQAIENKYAQPMLTNLQKVFLGQLDAKGFVDAMVAVP